MTTIDANDRIWTWKDITKFLNTSERSARRWAKLKDNPLKIYKDGPGVNARVFAYTSEIVAWRERRARMAG